MDTDPHMATLTYPLHAAAMEWPAKGASILCVGCSEPLSEIDHSDCQITYVQGFRPQYLALAESGCRVSTSFPPPDSHDLAFVRLGRHRRQNEAWIGEALRCVCPGGAIIAAGGKTDGAASLRKRIASTGADLSHAAKNHGVVFWMTVGDDREKLCSELTPEPEPPIEGRFHTAPGMFSHGRVDSGSELLAKHISCSPGARAADFCAGWGYLSAKLLEQIPEVFQLHLFEADHASLEAAKQNLLTWSTCQVEFYWQDLLRETLANHYDLIVMNPPFHRGRKAEPDIGQRLIQVAASALAPRGELLVVANRNLPYEEVLSTHFSRFAQLAAEDGYKVLRAFK